MTIRPCPSCAAPTPRLLNDLTKDGTVWYYRCQNCRHVWSIANKDDTQITHITPLPRRGDSST